jgi:hypothetical protein
MNGGCNSDCLNHLRHPPQGYTWIVHLNNHNTRYKNNSIPALKENVYVYYMYELVFEIGIVIFTITLTRFLLIKQTYILNMTVSNNVTDHITDFKM